MRLNQTLKIKLQGQNQMNEKEIAEKQIEISISNAREIVDKRDKMLKLIKDPLFKELIEEQYFKDEASRLVLLLTDPEFASDERQEAIRGDMIGISALRQYIRNVLTFGNQMEQQIANSENTLEELRNESTDME